MRFVGLLGVLVACGSSSRPAPSSSAAELLARVGDKPRVYLDVQDPAALLGPGTAADFMPSFAACNLDPVKLTRVRVAIGEPLRMVAEVDGEIDAKAVTCLLGSLSGITVTDRQGGVDIALQATSPTTTPLASELLSRCSGHCALVRLGPAAHPVWLSAVFTDHIKVTVAGAGLGAGLTAFAAAIAAVPDLASSHPAATGDTLTMDVPSNPDQLRSFAVTLHQRLIDALKIGSSSMEPTLHIGDRIISLKGPLVHPSPGDVLVFTSDENRDWVMRYIGAAGETIEHTHSGLSVGGKLLPTDPVDASYSYLVDRSQTKRAPGKVLREHLGERSYLVLQEDNVPEDGAWTVPPGTLFFVGDNRPAANDSRYRPATPSSAIKGRVATLWWAMRDGAPDWDRIGAPLQ